MYYIEKTACSLSNVV